MELPAIMAVLVLQSVQDIVLVTGALVCAEPCLGGSSEVMLLCPCRKSALYDRIKHYLEWRCD